MMIKEWNSNSSCNENIQNVSVRALKFVNWEKWRIKNGSHDTSESDNHENESKVSSERIPL